MFATLQSDYASRSSGAIMPTMQIRPARHADLAALETTMSTGLDRRHEARLRRQDAGLSTYLVAWDGELPVACG